MPITLSIGLSRKLSKDYNSHGYSVNLDVELPAEAVNDQQSISESADRLFQMADRLIDQQIAGHQQEVAEPGRTSGSNYQRTSTGSGRSNASNRNGRGITNAQSRAIESMARKLGQEPEAWARHEFGQEVQQLTIRQASELIDMLKQEIESREKVGR